jgi:ferrous iron transport protein B
MPVVETVAIRSEGLRELIARMEQEARNMQGNKAPLISRHEATSSRERISQILNDVIRSPSASDTLGDRIDSLVLHPVLGYVILAAILFGMFQAVYSWSGLPMEWIESGVEYTGDFLGSFLPDGILKGLLIDGILAGVGSVIVFLPQILILFFFILVLEESGYLPRAAFLLDRVMRSAGLSGRAFIPLLSCFACAIPGIMATRTIHDSRNRLATIMIAPLMTCSARLPVYLLIIGAFIPNTRVGIFNMQGLVLFGLYMSGIISAMIIALIIRLFIGKNQYQPLMMELPAYHLPNLSNLLLGLWERARIFITRAGTIILALMVMLWFLSGFPGAPENATEAAIRYSFAGQLGHMLQSVFEPIGFNWQLCIALIPGMAAREASVAALGTVYALSATGDELSVALSPVIAATWGLPTALSLLAWYVFAPQCISMIIVTRRETNSWKHACIMTLYLFALAYVASFATYRISLLFTGG